MRWKVRGIPLAMFNSDGGSVGEPFAAIQLPTKKGADMPNTIILTRTHEFYEGDEEKSSHGE